MKNFIDVETFLSLDTVIQKVIFKWWIENVKVGDLYMWELGPVEHCLNEFRVVKPNSKNILNRTWASCMAVPLLRMDQLVAFIEENKCHKLQIRLDEERYFIDIFKGLFIYKTNKSNILDALFEVACKIAKEKP